MTDDEARQTEAFSLGYRAWLLSILMLVNLLNLADRQGLAAVAPAVKLDLKLTDTELGLILGLGFAIFYTLLGLPIARLAEHYSSARIIAVCRVRGIPAAVLQVARLHTDVVLPGGCRCRGCRFRSAGCLAAR